MQDLNKLRIVQVGTDGVRPLADAMMMLAEDGRTVFLGVTSLQADVVVSSDVDAELTEGMGREVRIDELVSEYRPTMDPDVMRKWAAELVSLLAGQR
ncbi:hypothetical protein [Streptomyces sp. NPDC091027]|uniref:hypothetical protein n=1 Tax=Streptomyces sp. NPDC091027 TaxID=3365971 RepID=UPI0038003139